MSQIQRTAAKNNFGFSVDFSWGVSSLRQCAGFPASFLNPEDQKSYVTPLGALVVCWDIEKTQRKLSFQAHNDLITVMLHNARLNTVLTACYSGEIKLWNSNWEVLFNTKARVGEIHFADWSSFGDQFLLCGGEDSVVIVYDLAKCEENPWEIKEKWIVAAPQMPKNCPDGNCASEGSTRKNNPSSSELT